MGGCEVTWKEVEAPSKGESGPSGVARAKNAKNRERAAQARSPSHATGFRITLIDAHRAPGMTGWYFLACYRVSLGYRSPGLARRAAPFELKEPAMRDAPSSETP